MNKRRFMLAIVLAMVLVLSISMLVACKNELADVEVTIPQNGGGEGEEPYFPGNFTKVEYKGMELQEGMDSFDLLNEAYNNWIEDDGYYRDQYFSFRADNAPMHSSPITQFCHDQYKIDGKQLYRDMVKVQNSGPIPKDKREYVRFYYDGSKAMRAGVDSDKVVPGNDPKDLFKVNSVPAMEAFSGSKELGSVEDMLHTYKTHLTTYRWNQKKNLVDDGWKVYKAKDGTLRFTITIRCEDKVMQNIHKEARKEFADSTGASLESLHMEENTTIDFIVKDFDGKKKFVAWRRTEQYSGIHKDLGGDRIKAKQTSVELFSYDPADYTIKDADKK